MEKLGGIPDNPYLLTVGGQVFYLGAILWSDNITY